MASPALTALDSVTFAENAVNATPQLIDSNVVFSDADNDFNGGKLIVSGLLAEDRVAIQNSSMLYVSGGNLYFDGDGAMPGLPMPMGTVTGGVGGTFTVTFNATATAFHVDLVIQSLTYANVSDTPTATRTLRLNVIDAAGNDLDSPTTYAAQAGVIDLPAEFTNGAMPCFVDMDGDGDLDLFVGRDDNAGTRAPLSYFRNDGTSASPNMVDVTGTAADPFAAYTGPNFTALAFGDLDNDGDLDAIMTGGDGLFRYFRNTGTASAPVMAEITGAGNPMNGVEVGDYGIVDFADIDGDGDLDLLVAADVSFGIQYFENTGSAAAPVLTERAGPLNPFSAITFASVGTSVAAGDVDGDGDIDVLLGDGPGDLRFLENIGTTTAPSYVQRTGAANPFNGITVGDYTVPSFGDVDGDGDLDLIIGSASQVVFVQANGGLPTITITVTAQAEGPSEGADTVTGGSSADSLEGLGGDDTVDGAGGDDTIDGGAGTDTLIGGAGADYLKGGDGDDILRGGTDDDTYVVDSTGDQVDETGGNGWDTVWSRVSWTLGSALEALTLGAGAGDANGTGNSLANWLTGNSFNNVLSGEAGNDVIWGGQGHDTLNGGDGEDDLRGEAGNDLLNGGADDDTLDGGLGNDRLDGGAGADLMNGGAGNDIYVIDDAGDIVSEGVGAGTDTIETASTLSLAARTTIENLTLTGSANADGTGNSLANTLTGNSGNNVLLGGAGADLLFGGDGNDTLNGQGGADKLTGGAGADRFVFEGETGDRIMDLNFAAGDIVDLSAIDANSLLAGEQAIAFVTRFGKHAGEATLAYTAANNVTTLLIDVDGDGRYDLQFFLQGDHSGTKSNLYTGGGDANGGWVL